MSGKPDKAPVFPDAEFQYFNGVSPSLEIAALRRQVDELQAQLHEGVSGLRAIIEREQFKAERDALRAEADDLRQDKARLDWLDGNCTRAANSERYLPITVYWGKGTHRDVRTAIDVARLG